MNSRSVWEFYCRQNEVIPLAEIKGGKSTSENLLQIQTQSIFENTSAFKIETGDISQSISIYNSRQQNNLFQLETLDEFKSPRYPTPQLGSLVENLLKENRRLLLLGGNYDDKKELARYLATDLLEKNNQPKTKIFILYDITPQQLNKSLYLKDIDSYAHEGNNYVIAVTNESLSQWGLTSDEQDYWWYEPKINELYKPEALVKSLFEYLNDDIKSDLIELESVIRDKITAHKLRTFASILRCARILNNLNNVDISESKESKKTEERGKSHDTNKTKIKPITLEYLDEIFEDANNQKNSLKQWYETLTDKDQIIALALTFFDGFLEDQFFEALYELVVKTRSFRNKELESADQKDLENLTSHFIHDTRKYPQVIRTFKFVKSKSEITDIEIRSFHIRSEDERLVLFEIAWEKYRRQILNALPVIVNFIRESADESPINLALYGSPLHRNKIRDVLVQTLSNLGLVSGAISAIQEALFQLAADDRFEVQEVVARVIEYWYAYSRSSALFYTQDKDKRGKKESLGTLQVFYSRAMEVALNRQETRNIQNNVTATIALSVTRIAAYDPPGELTEEMCDWLKELAYNKSQIVANYLGYNTLYNLVLRHLEKLSITLKEITQLNALINTPIAASLANAYGEDRTTSQGEKYTDKVWNTLNTWCEECERDWQATNQITNTENYQRLLRTVAIAYGRIQFDKNEIDRIASAFDRLHTILINEEQSFVCEPTTTSILSLSNQYFEQIESELDILGYGFSDDRRRQVVEVIKSVYQSNTQLTKETDDILQDLEVMFRTVGLAKKVNQDNKILVSHTLQKLFKMIGKESRSLINKTVQIAIRLLADIYFELFVSQLELVTHGISEEKQQEIINIMIEIYLDQRSMQKGGDGMFEVKGCHYPMWTDPDHQRPLTNLEQTMSHWLNNSNRSEFQRQLAVESSLEFIRALGTLDLNPSSMGLIKDLEKYAPKCSDNLRNKFVEILTEIHRDQREQNQQSETDIQKIIVYWLKNENNPEIKQIAMRASLEFLNV
jgi:hypothetical protein